MNSLVFVIISTYKRSNYVHSDALSIDYKDRFLYMLKYIDKHSTKIKESKIRWSKLQKRLGELNAVNKYRKEAFRAFVLAHINRLLKLVILIKIDLSILGKKNLEMYCNKLKITISDYLHLLVFTLQMK